MVDADRIAEVLGEMARLKVRIDAHVERLQTDETYARYYRITGGPETAAIKRASLDLTRALAKLRR